MSRQIQRLLRIVPLLVVLAPAAPRVAQALAPAASPVAHPPTPAALPADPSREWTMGGRRFGTLHVYQPSAHPQRVVLFVSGDGGWNLGVVDMARMLERRDTLVVGINIRQYLRGLGAEAGSCAYPAADFESLSQAVQQKVGMPNYEPPVLVGYSSGATLVYAVLAEAPANTFRGAVGLGFCPDLDLPKELCKGNGLEFDVKERPRRHPLHGHRAAGEATPAHAAAPPAATPAPAAKATPAATPVPDLRLTYIFRPAQHLEGKFVVLQGTIDKVCDPPSTERYVHQVPGGEVVMLDKVGHGFAVPSRWQAAFEHAVSSMYGGRPVATATAATPSGPEGVEDLPLVEVPVKRKVGTAELAVLLSGDGGWAGIDRDVAGALAAAGMPVVGWNSLQYYWHPRTPDQAAADLARILRRYLARWHAEHAVLVGYSFGADVLPFLVMRLPEELRSRVSLVTLLGPSHEATFEFHVSEWLHQDPKGEPTLPEVEKLQGMPILCVYGEKEAESLCPDLPAGLAQLLPTSGAHHFGGDYKKLAGAVLAAARTPPAGSSG